MDYKTQEKRVVEILLTNGRVTRNWALSNYMSRLGAIVFNLKKAGWDIKGRYERTHGGYGRDKDFVYVLISSPTHGKFKKLEVVPQQSTNLV